MLLHLLKDVDNGVNTTCTGTPLWRYGGHPKMLGTLDLQKVAGEYQRACRAFSFWWSDMLDGSKAGGTMTDDDDARRFPVALLCLDEEFRRTAESPECGRKAIAVGYLGHLRAVC